MVVTGAAVVVAEDTADATDIDRPFGFFPGQATKRPPFPVAFVVPDRTCGFRNQPHTPRYGTLKTGWQKLARS